MFFNEKQREKADKILTQYFKKQKGKPIRQDKAYLETTSITDTNNTTCHWAFFEWIDKQIQEGKMEKKPIKRTEIIGYELIYKPTTED